MNICLVSAHSVLTSVKQERNIDILCVMTVVYVKSKIVNTMISTSHSLSI